MKTFINSAAQGDCYFQRIIELPDVAIRVVPVDGKIIVAHSETGYHHVMDSDTVEMYRLPDSILDCFLVVKDSTVLEHLRMYDTHESIMFSPGVYHVRRQREYVPEGWRRVND